jgi:hypothetical protein
MPQCEFDSRRPNAVHQPTHAQEAITMQKKAPVRPLFNMPGELLVELIARGEKSALDEAKFRSSKSVRAAVAAHDAKAPARTRSAKSIRAELAKQVAPARKTGVGSRGGDPRKAEAFAVALATGAKVWSPDFKAAYKAHLESLVGAAV